MKSILHLTRRQCFSVLLPDLFYFQIKTVPCQVSIRQTVGLVFLRIYPGFTDEVKCSRGTVTLPPFLDPSTLVFIIVSKRKEEGYVSHM